MNIKIDSAEARTPTPKIRVYHANHQTIKAVDSGARNAHYKSLNTGILENDYFQVFEVPICSLSPSNSKLACFRYNPKYYESETFDVRIITYRFEIIRTLQQRGTCKETTRNALKENGRKDRTASPMALRMKTTINIQNSSVIPVVSPSLQPVWSRGNVYRTLITLLSIYFRNKTYQNPWTMSRYDHKRVNYILRLKVMSSNRENRPFFYFILIHMIHKATKRGHIKENCSYVQYLYS